MVKAKEHSPEQLKGFIEQAQAELAKMERKGKKAANKAKADLTKGKNNVEDFIKEHPFATVGAAFLIGYLLGNLKRR